METFDFTSPAYYTSGLQAVIAGGVYARPTLAAVIAALLGTIDPKAQLVGILLVISVVAFGHLGDSFPGRPQGRRPCAGRGGPRRHDHAGKVH